MEETLIILASIFVLGIKVAVWYYASSWLVGKRISEYKKSHDLTDKLRGACNE